MDLDVICVHYPGLRLIRWEKLVISVKRPTSRYSYLKTVISRQEEGECALRQSVLELRGQLLALLHKTVSFRPVLGETLQPGFHGMVWHAPACIRTLVSHL